MVAKSKWEGMGYVLIFEAPPPPLRILIPKTSYPLRIAVRTIQPIAYRRKFPVIIVHSPRKVMYTMRPRVQNPFERHYIHIVMDTESP